jgi:hypothetical protein
MNKSLFVIITLLVISVSNASAQAVWGGRIGLSQYTETVKASGMSDFSGNAPGIELGPVLYYSLQNNWYINSGAMLGIMVPADVDYLGRSDVKNYYLDIPLYLGLNIPVGNSNLSFFGQAGPYIGYWGSTDESINDLLNPFQAGVALMAGINIKRFKIELGYKAGLTNLTSNEGGYSNGITYLESSSKLTSLFLGVSYVF